MGIYEERREAGEFSKADSVRWLSAMKPDTEVAWTEPTTRAVDFTLTGRSTSDTVSVWIMWRYGMVRQKMSLVADHRGRCHFRWNLDNDAGARVEPGVYCVWFERKKFKATLFYVVIR
jgi:flagellar hook assembly protein FlgD